MVFHRALWNAYGAIDALSRVNDQRDWPLVETIHGTDVDTIGVLALDAAIGDYVGHRGLLIAALDTGCALDSNSCSVYNIGIQ